MICRLWSRDMRFQKAIKKYMLWKVINMLRSPKISKEAAEESRKAEKENEREDERLRKGEVLLIVSER